MGAVFDNPDHGKPYTCGECRVGLHRDQFLLCDLADFQGKIYGLCHPCAVEWKQWTREDCDGQSYAWRKECKARHKQRDDIKQRDHQRVRTARFESLMEEALKEKPQPGTSATQAWRHAREQVVAFLRPAVEDVFAAVSESSEFVRSNFVRIMQRYAKLKEVESVDSALVVMPLGGGGVQNAVQFLDRIGRETRRFYICRSVSCSERGSFYGANTSWVSPVHEGGWQFCCPNCGAPYRAGSKTDAVLPGHHIWVLERERRVILAEWPESAEEDTIGRLMLNFKEEDLGDLQALSADELQDTIMKMVDASSMPCFFEKMQLKAETIAYLEGENLKRTKQKKWGWSHLEAGFEGTFCKHGPGNAIMSRKDVKIFLAALFCLSRRHTGGSP